MLQTLLDSCAALGVPLTAAQAEQLCDFCSSRTAL